MENIFSVCIIGSGNGATALAKIVAENTKILSHFEDRVNMYVYDEQYEGKNLCDYLKTHHRNPKYAPNLKLPENVVAVNNVVETAKNADIIIFVMPHAFLADFCRSLLGQIKPEAIAIAVSKGFATAEDGGMQLVSQTVIKYLKIPCSVLVATNYASEIALGHFCEATIGCSDLKYSNLFKDLFHFQNFRVTVLNDAECIEACGCLKHILSFGVGLLDGLDSNFNTKATLIRFGILEIIRFVDVFYPFSKLITFFESCGLADLITACNASRNRRLGEAFVKSSKSIEQLERELLGGEKSMGPLVAKAVSVMLKSTGLENRFPIFTTISKICEYLAKPEDVEDLVRNISDIIYHPLTMYPL